MIDTLFHSDAVDDGMYDEAIDTDDGENDEENFQIQLADDSKKFVLVNTRVDYQYRSDNLNSACFYDFVSIFDKKKNEKYKPKTFIHDGSIRKIKNE